MIDLKDNGAGNITGISAGIVVIAAFNEGDLIGETVSSLVKARSAIPVLVIDDASTDDTAEVAEQNGASVIRLEKNLGKGGALNYGVGRLLSDAASETEPSAVLFIDADLGATAPKAFLLFDAINKDECDLAIAKFPKPKIKGGFGLVKGLARWGINKKAGKLCDEPLSGQRAMSVMVLKKVYPFAEGFGIEVKMSIDALTAGYRVEEFEVALSHRFSTRSLKGFYHRGKQFFAVLRVLIS